MILASGQEYRFYDRKNLPCILVTKENLMRFERISSLAISKNGFVFDPENGSSYTVNDTGLHILKKLQAGATREDIVASLLEEYDTDIEYASSDYEHFVAMLKALDLAEV